MMFLRLIVDMVKVHLEDLDFAETRAIGWKLLLLATIAAEIKTTNLLR